MTRSASSGAEKLPDALLPPPTGNWITSDSIAPAAAPPLAPPEDVAADDVPGPRSAWLPPAGPASRGWSSAFSACRCALAARALLNASVSALAFRAGRLGSPAYPGRRVNRGRLGGDARGIVPRQGCGCRRRALRSRQAPRPPPPFRPPPALWRGMRTFPAGPSSSMPLSRNRVSFHGPTLSPIRRATISFRVRSGSWSHATPSLPLQTTIPVRTNRSAPGAPGCAETAALVAPSSIDRTTEIIPVFNADSSLVARRRCARHRPAAPPNATESNARQSTKRSTERGGPEGAVEALRPSRV